MQQPFLPLAGSAEPLLRDAPCAALERLQHRAAELGAEAIELHVFAVNPTAHALYRSLGYGITGYKMIKRLGPAAA